MLSVNVDSFLSQHPSRRAKSLEYRIIFLVILKVSDVPFCVFCREGKAFNILVSRHCVFISCYQTSHP